MDDKSKSSSSSAAATMPTSPTLQPQCQKDHNIAAGAAVVDDLGSSNENNSVSHTAENEQKSSEKHKRRRNISSLIVKAPQAVSSVPGSAKRMVDSGAKKVRDLAEKTGTVSILTDFRDFVSRGNVMDLAVALVMGSAFTAVVNSLVKDIINPLISLGMPGNTFGGYSVIKPGASGSWSYISLAAAQADGAIVEVR